MATRFKSVIAVLAAVMVVATAACAGDLPAPTPNIEATVEARVKQERAIEATVEARVKEEKASQPTPTPTATNTPVPTATPTPKLKPTPNWRWTWTPSPTLTPDIDATVETRIQATIEAIPTPTPTPAPTPTPNPTPTPSLVNIPPGLTIDLVIDRIVDPTNIGGGFVSYEGPIESRGRKWLRDEKLEGGMSVGVLFEEYQYFVGNPTEYGEIAAMLTGPYPGFVADDFFERSVLVLGAMGFTEKAARSLLEQMRFKIKSANKVQECVGGLTVRLTSLRLDDEGELTAGMIIVTEIPCESKSIESNTRIIAQWSGKSIKNTETFNVPTQEWKISWDTRPGDYGEMNFQILVYNADGTPHLQNFVVANVIGANKDSSVMRGSGRYYLTFNAGQLYDVTVTTLP